VRHAAAARNLLPSRFADLPSTRFDPKLIAERLEAKAYLHGGLTIELRDEAAGTAATFHYEDGLRAYLEKLVGESGGAALAGEIVTIQKEQDDLHLECALAWTEDTSERVQSFVNGIPTTPAARTKRPAGGAGEGCPQLPHDAQPDPAWAHDRGRGRA
jgi:DNA gyrase/topoisomerase IV subunit B